MGLSASQARQLLLTAKRNDLEFRAQQISQQRLILSSQLEEIATEYENATANRQMQVTLYEQVLNSDGSWTTVKNPNINLTYATLVSGCHNNSGANKLINKLDDSETEGYMNSAYLLKDGDGRIVVSSYDEIPGLAESGIGKDIELNSRKKIGYSMEEAINDYEIQVVTDSGTIKVTKYKEETDESGKTVSVIDYVQEYVVDEALLAGSTDQYGEKAGPNYIQDCLRNGLYTLSKYSAEKNNWSPVSWDSAVGITDRYYTEDDDAAKAKYDRLQNEIQRQDKKLELELDNIETQRSAITTEEESVQKVMDDNIEGTFKTFA